MSYSQHAAGGRHLACRTPSLGHDTDNDQNGDFLKAGLQAAGNNRPQRRRNAAVNLPIKV